MAPAAPPPAGDERPTWSSASGAVTLFNNLMPDFAQATDPAYSILVENATATNGRGQTCVYDKAHGYALQHGLYSKGTWREPAVTTGTIPTVINICIAHAETARTAALNALTSAHASSGSTATFVAPAHLAAPITEASQLPIESHYVPSPDTIRTASAKLFNLYLAGYTSKHIAETHRRSFHSDASLLIRHLRSLEPSIPTKATGAQSNALYLHMLRGYQDPSIESYDAWHTTGRELRAVQPSFAMMPAETFASHMVTATNNFGDTVEFRLNGLIDASNADRVSHSMPATTRIDAALLDPCIRQVLEDISCDSNMVQLARASRGRALASIGITDPRRNTSPSDSRDPNDGEKRRKIDFSVPFSKSGLSPCPFLTKGVKCNGQHYKKNCPKFKAFLAEKQKESTSRQDSGDGSDGGGKGKAHVNAGFADLAPDDFFDEDGSASEAALLVFMEDQQCATCNDDEGTIKGTSNMSSGEPCSSFAQSPAPSSNTSLLTPETLAGNTSASSVEFTSAAPGLLDSPTTALAACSQPLSPSCPTSMADSNRSAAVSALLKSGLPPDQLAAALAAIAPASSNSAPAPAASTSASKRWYVLTVGPHAGVNFGDFNGVNGIGSRTCGMSGRPNVPANPRADDLDHALRLCDEYQVPPIFRGPSEYPDL